MGVSFFISCVSSEFAAYREALRHALTLPDVHIKIQEDFRPYADDTLVMLETYVAHSDGVVHFIGEEIGWTPPSVCVKRLLSRRPDLAAKLADLGLTRADLDSLSATQWEAWLAVVLERRLLPVTPTPGGPSRDEQKRHLDRLKALARHPLTFTSEDNLVALLFRSSINDALIEAGHATTPRQPNNLPYGTLGPLFKGRDDFLDELHAELAKSGRGAVAGKAIHGLGGVGKTRAAIEYALRYAHAYSALLFVRAETPESLDSNLANLVSAAVPHLPEQKLREDAPKIAAALGWLSHHPTWLLIFDNVDDEPASAAIAKYLPKLSGGHVIVTGRLTKYPAGVRKLELGVLDEDDATEFLLERTADDRLIRPDDDVQARALARELGGLALGLEQAGAYIAADRIGFVRYCELWREAREKLLAWFDPYATNSNHALATVWATSVARLAPESRRLLDRLAFLAPDPIPDFLLDVKPEDDDLDARAAMRDLWKYSLISRAVYEDGKATHDGFAMHRLVQDYARRSMDEAGRKEALRETLMWLTIGFELDGGDVAHWPRLDPLAPHALAVAQAADEAGGLEPLAHLFGWLDIFYDGKGRYLEAVACSRRALSLCETSRPLNQTELASRLNNLASLLTRLDQAGEAEPLLRRAIKICGAKTARDDPETTERLENLSAFLGNLASLLSGANRISEAEKLYRRALRMGEASLGRHHPKVALRLNNLAELLRTAKRYEEAERLFRRALKINETSFGPDHPEVAVCIGNLAHLLTDLNRIEEAERLLRRALEIDEKHFGPNHAKVGRDLNNLGSLLQDTHRAAQAAPLHRRALAIFEASYGPDHPSTQTVRRNWRRATGGEA